jgi:LmbE family N-acetylglucosaminyl deacetylase
VWIADRPANRTIAVDQHQRTMVHALHNAAADRLNEGFDTRHKLTVRNPCCVMTAVARTLLAVHAHPDDESITTGGTLARYAAEGVRTVLVTCTGGDLGEVAFDHDEAVGSLRARELADAACVLGLSRVVQLGYADSGMAGWPDNHRAGAFFAAPLEEARARLLRIFGEEQPDVVLTYDETGGYGHPDHLKAHQVTLAAWQAAPARKLYFVRIPLGWSRRFVNALRAAGISAPSTAAAGAGGGTDEVGVADELVTTEVDVRAYVETKRAAIACHRSQMPADHFLMRMPHRLATTLWACEFFSREAGPTTAQPGALETDLFDGLP